MSPPAAYIVPSATMQTSPQAKTFPAYSNLLSLCPMTKVCGIFSEEFFPSSSGGRQRAARSSKTQSPTTGPQTATLFLRLRDSAHPMGTQSVSGDSDSVCTFKRILRLRTFRRDVLFSSAHNSSSFEGQFFVCYWIARAELLAIGQPVTVYPETFIHHKLCIASSSLEWVEAMPQQKNDCMFDFLK